MDVTEFETNRLFKVNILDRRFLDRFGVRWVMTRDESPSYATMLADADYRLVQPGTSYFRVFEYVRAKPSWRFEGGDAEMKEWAPERRVFRVRAGGRRRG